MGSPADLRSPHYSQAPVARRIAGRRFDSRPGVAKAARAVPHQTKAQRSMDNKIPGKGLILWVLARYAKQPA
ncbi:hypothetical protein Pssp01_61490 [Pseudomonas sp. NBRC 100443]|nr:hypothetical protein Pssp01_61490 [Pseudomonas sp. NBRC 100443]